MSDYIEYTVTVYENGHKEWYIDDRLHREDGPAIECSDGTKSWWLNGKRHREGNPAVEYADGHKSWWLNGKRHREDGPAVERSDGTKSWYLNGELHREDGPAVKYADGGKEWWLNGVELTEEEFNARNMYIKDIPSDTPVMTFNPEPSIVEDVTVTLLGEEHVIPAAQHPTGAFEAAMLAVALKLHQRLEELESKNEDREAAR